MNMITTMTALQLRTDCMKVSDSSNSHALWHKVRIALLFCLLSLSFPAFSNPIDEAAAYQIVQTFIQHHQVGGSSRAFGKQSTVDEIELVFSPTDMEDYRLQETDNQQKTVAVHRVSTNNQSQSAPLFYVFNTSKKSFVIVSGDDNVGDILGYSDASAFSADSIPCCMRYLLASYAKEIETCRRTGAIHRSQTYNDRQVIPPMLTCHWSQGGPYNLLTEGNVTGCVATAMAQVMYYWKWPHQTKMLMPNTTRLSDKELPVTTFEWGLMKDNYEENDMSAAGYAVAKLMKYCGVSVNMDYGGDESTATLNTVNMQKYFDYSTSLHALAIDSYTVHQLDSIIYNEMKSKRPVLFNVPRHVVVCDGYDGVFYHFNWGWGGNHDGYFRLSIADGCHIIGIQPSGNNVDPDEGKALSLRSMNMGSSADTVLLSRTEGAGSVLKEYINYEYAFRCDPTIKFEITLGVFMNGNLVTADEIGIKSDEGDGRLCWEYWSKNSYHYYSNFAEKLSDGTYTLRPVYRQKGTWQWLTDIVDVGKQGSATIVVKGDTIFFHPDDVGNSNNMEVNSVIWEDNQGTDCKLHINITNHGEAKLHEIKARVKYYYPYDIHGYYYDDWHNENKIALFPSGATQTVSLNMPNLEPGDSCYVTDLSIYIDNEEVAPVVWPDTLSLIPIPRGRSDLELTCMNVNPGAIEEQYMDRFHVYGTTYSFDVKAKNIGSNVFEGIVGAGLYEYEKSRNNRKELLDSVVVLQPGDSVIVHFDFKNLKTDFPYYKSVAYYSNYYSWDYKYMDSSYDTDFTYKSVSNAKYVFHQPNDTIYIGREGYTTRWTTENYILPEGLTGMIVTGADGNTLLVDTLYHVGDTIPSRTGVLLEGAEGTYILPRVLDFLCTTTAPRTNYLGGSTYDWQIEEDDDYYIYRLKEDSLGLNTGFYWGAENGGSFVNPAYQAPLFLPTGMTAATGFPLKVNTTVMGDIDKNRRCNANDMSLLTNLILNRPIDVSIDNRAADLDENNRVASNDASLLVGKILNYVYDESEQSRAKSRVAGKQLDDVNSSVGYPLSIEDVSLTTGHVMMLPVNLNTSLGEFCNLQMDITLPSNVSVCGAELYTEGGRVNSSYHQILVQKLSNGSTRLFLYSPDNTVILSGVEPIFNIMLMTETNIDDTEHCTMEVNNIVLARSDGTDVIEQNPFTVNLNANTTMIENMEDDMNWIDNKEVYDVSGRRIQGSALKAKSLKGGVYIVNGRKVMIK